MHSGSTEVDLLSSKCDLILLNNLVIASFKNSILLWWIILVHHHAACTSLKLMLVVLLAHPANTSLKDVLLLHCSILHQGFLLLLLGEDADLRFVSAHA